MLTVFAKISISDFLLGSEYSSDLVSIYLLKYDNRDTKTMFWMEIIHTEKDLQILGATLFKYDWPWHFSVVFIVNFQIFHILRKFIYCWFWASKSRLGTWHISKWNVVSEKKPLLGNLLNAFKLLLNLLTFDMILKPNLTF